MHFYNKVKQSVAKDSRLEIKTIRYASPGCLELRLDLQAAKELRLCLDARAANADALGVTLREALTELKRHGYSQQEVGRTTSANIPEEHCALFASLLADVGKQIAFPYVERLEKLAANPIAALKILLSFEKRLKRLARYEENGMAILVA